MSMESVAQLYNRVKPFFVVIVLQIGSAGMTIICKFALDQGMSQHVLIVYRYAVATAVIAPFALVFDRSLSLSPLLIVYTCMCHEFLALIDVIR